MMRKPLIETHWQEHDLDDVCRYFGKDFKPPGKMLHFEYFVDVYRRKVVFKLITEKGTPCPNKL